MKKILILGAGVSGRAAAQLARYSGMTPVIVDEKNPVPEDGIELLSGWTPSKPLPTAELAVISPGISIFSPIAEAVRKAGIPLIGELEFASSFLPEKCRFCAITGTNGKTTTTELTTALFRSAGLRAESAGNIGASLSAAVLRIIQGDPIDLLTVETSSFQLESCSKFHPSSAAILNLASDHINRHGSFENYAAVKFSLLNGLVKPPVLNENLRERFLKFHPACPQPVTFSASMPEADLTLKNNAVCFHGKPVLDIRETKLPGLHNAENMMAALALLMIECGEAALFSGSASAALRTFAPEAHRMEIFHTANGIRFMDDSKATNPHSVNAMLKTFGGEKNVILLLGGSDKNMDFSSIALDSACIKSAVVYGACREKIYAALNKAFPCRMAGMDFREAIRLAKADAVSGDIVALSPACASFDMFKSYADRGEQFKQIVQESAD